MTRVWIVLALMMSALANAGEPSLIELMNYANRGECGAVEQLIESNAEADFFRAALYETGRWYPLDSQKALEYYEKAAALGNSDAMYSVFLLIAQRASPSRTLTAEEMAVASDRLKRAGELKNWRAAQALSDCYKYGAYGFPKDEGKSAEWRIVYEQGKPPSAP